MEQNLLSFFFTLEFPLITETEVADRCSKRAQSREMR